MAGRSSLEIIESFLADGGCDLDPRPYIEAIPLFSTAGASLPGDIVEKIIRDSYDDANPLIKDITSKLAGHFHVLIGRVHKNQLKKYIDYERPADLETFVKMIGEDGVDAESIKHTCNEIIKTEKNLLKKSLPVFWNNLNDAIAKGNRDRVKDYVVFLYSRLLALNENRQISLRFLFEQERDLIEDELVNTSLEGQGTRMYHELEVYCASDERGDRAAIISRFNKKYLDLLEGSDGTREKKSLIYMCIDQALFDGLHARMDFFDYLYSCMKKSFAMLRNHRVLAIRVGNVMADGMNLKWDIYAHLTVFAEKFRPARFNRTYYHAEEICADIIEHKLKQPLTADDREQLKHYYVQNGQKDHVLQGIFAKPEIKEIIEHFKHPLSGFSFMDCYILQHAQNFDNSRDIQFIGNKGELLLIFSKNVVDERKIPCPVCGSLKISGNSYTEIGEKSWECKNPLCAERSKTNRGKRYSMRTITMQDSLYDFSTENMVPKGLIKVWRKDIVERWNEDNLHAMLVKYYTYPGDSVIAIGVRDAEAMNLEATRQKRILEAVMFDDIIKKGEHEKGICLSFENGALFSRLIYDVGLPASATRAEHTIPMGFVKKGQVCIVQDDCMSAMRQMETGSVHAMITSPPYYNAREYSQWANLYTYLNDMYAMISRAREILVPGGVFFYNIGDIYDNENVIVKSTMGNKRIPLGAYIILLFQKAGFALLDNIVWYKGEPQSNRQKNDGNFVPFYQRPTNCYEHMFIFKTPGKLLLARDRSKSTLHSNVQKFSPVIKIGKDGVNKYGHTAPFPQELPLLAIHCFTNLGETVYDPFSGSGTTAIVAALSERGGIGTEMSPEYAELSVKMAMDQGLKATLLKRLDGGHYTRALVDPAIMGKKTNKQTTLDGYS